jgi:hypothetical protein
MERSLVQKGIDYLKKVGNQLVGVSGKEAVVVKDKQADIKPISAQLQSEIQNLESEMK